MKEMCKNFVCNAATACPVASQQDTGTVPPSNTSMGDCNTCVIERVGLAQAFVPTQPFQQPMSQEQSLVCGTAFSDLVMPYCSGWNLYRFAKEA